MKVICSNCKQEFESYDIEWLFIGRKKTPICHACLRHGRSDTLSSQERRKIRKSKDDNFKNFRRS